MELNDRMERTDLAELAVPNDVGSPAAASTGYWLARGAMVGLALGASAGSIVPIYGTMFGAAGGTAAGTAIGFVMMVFAAVTRNLFPAAPGTVEIREAIACVVTIWIPVLVIRDVAVLLAIPAALGSIHALAAGTPIDGKVYTGNVSAVRQKICTLLPVAILGVVACGWAYYFHGLR